MKLNQHGKLYLIPVPLSDDGLHQLSVEIYTLVPRLTLFVAEKAKTARKWIKAISPDVDQSSIEVIGMDKHDPLSGIKNILNRVKDGQSVGLMSEAGCPGIADPGTLIVAAAHLENIEVVPVSGPSSILLALMASGLNGQLFSFEGYLPPQKPELKLALRSLESLSKKDGSTRIFIETPYRNTQILETALQTLHPNTHLCIAKDLGGRGNGSIAEQSAIGVRLKFLLYIRYPAYFY
jgi:16S rRNA (cytidine1402-2'-O)-methyltransferase